MSNLKPGDMHGKHALLRSERVAEKVAKDSLKSLGTKEVLKITKGGPRGPGKHYKGIYN
jgi:hypothetical protein